MRNRFLFTLIFLLSTTSLALAGSGKVIFYKDSNFRGKSFTVKVSSKRKFGYRRKLGRWNDKISSIRIIGNAQVTVFGDSRYRGPRRLITRDVRWLSGLKIRSSRRNWNDRISSVKVIYRRSSPKGKELGSVTFYQHSNYRGKSFTVRVQDRARGGRGFQILRSIQSLGNWNDRISSVKLRGKIAVHGFCHARFRGPYLRITRSIRKLSAKKSRNCYTTQKILGRYGRNYAKTWNDAISSIRIYRSR